MENQNTPGLQTEHMENEKIENLNVSVPQTYASSYEARLIETIHEKLKEKIQKNGLVWDLSGPNPWGKFHSILVQYYAGVSEDDSLPILKAVKRLCVNRNLSMTHVVNKKLLPELLQFLNTRGDIWIPEIKIEEDELEVEE